LELISFRVLQGVGAGLIQANSNAIVTDASPPNELGLMIGINQTSLRVGSISGLTLAGIILSLTDWRGLFYINIPIGIFATLWAHKRLREISVKDPSKKMDFVGFLLFSVGLTFLLLSITFLSYGAGDLTEAMGFLAAGAVLLAAFVIAQSKTVFPLLDLSLFRIKLFAAANLAQVLNSIVWSGLLVLFAFYLQIGLGYTAFEAGIAIAPLELAYVVSSLISAKLSDKYGSTILTSTGLVIITLSFVAASTFGESTHYWKFVIVLLFCGAGNGMFTPPNLRAIMGSVPAIRRGVAAGFRQTMFNSGSTCGYGLVILFLTFGIPYATLSPLIQGTISNGAISLARVQFFDGYRISCILFAIVDGLAIIPSVLRGHPSPQNAIARAETYQR
jgi:MFS family permease